MTVSLKLSNSLYICPKNWFNFIIDIRTRLEINDENEGFMADAINRELARFKARYIPKDPNTGRRPRVDFADERYYNLFVIAYGGER